jgi:Flp pilus assembly protein TadD
MALDLKAKLAIQADDYGLALELYRKLAPIRSADPEVWAGFGYAALRQGNLDEALDAFRRAVALRPDPQYDYYTGLVCASLGRWDEAVEALGRSVRGDKDGMYYHALAMALEAREAVRGGPPIPNGLTAAQAAAARAVERAPKSVTILSYQRHIDRVVAGEEPPRDLIR